jgi:hypothetical protein
MPMRKGFGYRHRGSRRNRLKGFAASISLERYGAGTLCTVRDLFGRTRFRPTLPGYGR